MQKTKQLIMSLVAAATLLSSCSRQMASTASVSKMMSKEVLTSAKIQPQNNIAPCLPDVNIPQQMADNATAAVVKNHDNAMVRPGTKYHPALFAKNFKQEVISDVKRQATAITTFGLNKRAVSYSGTQHTEGYLGIAGMCLISDIVLGILGFTSGHWFWDRAVILVVAAIVFFLLYLIAKAASPRSE